MAVLEVKVPGEVRPVVISEEALFTLPSGFVGYPDWQRFALIPAPEGYPFTVLQSIDDAEVSFLVTDPRLLWPDYLAAVADDVLQRIEASGPDDLRLLCTLNVQEDGSITANLLGPIALSVTSRLACQLVLYDTEYSTQHELPSGHSAAFRASLVR